ncbi:GatB/YqeY domain-containing protein [Robiginitalea marina]|uniref:GatB/YqeY domain-containing protein n=1 Tax=Robiginitalea marina TaxID=2954105 RepID=A0ABT1AYW2_9FLAO|nr:GatB/YqeY domain-containing protein [Robiginitalea marina]MCO5724775.1 GatB/YqeY domain-containing protein [Robiginitalea marina]
MSLQEQVMEQIKAAMKARDTVSLESLRAIKSALLLMQTDKGGVKTLSEAEEIALVQKLVKQRRESASIFQEQGRADLAEAELQQIAVMERFLPEQLSEAEVGQEVARAIASLGAKDLKDMGRVMGEVTRTLAGRADGKLIAALVRSQLGQ